MGGCFGKEESHEPLLQDQRVSAVRSVDEYVVVKKALVLVKQPDLLPNFQKEGITDARVKGMDMADLEAIKDAGLRSRKAFLRAFHDSLKTGDAGKVRAERPASYDISRSPAKQGEKERPKSVVVGEFLSDLVPYQDESQKSRKKSQRRLYSNNPKEALTTPIEGNLSIKNQAL